MVKVNVGINSSGRVRGATNNFLNGHNYSSQPEPSAGESFGIYEGGESGDITSLFYVFAFYYERGRDERCYLEYLSKTPLIIQPECCLTVKYLTLN